MSNEDGHQETFFINNTVLMIYTYIVTTVLCQLINIFGIVTNIINIICFVKQGFKDSINISLLGLSISDLFSLFTMIWTCIFLTPEFTAADLPFDILDVIYVILSMQKLSFTRISSCITAMITIERCLSIVAPLKVKSIVSPKRIALTIVSLFVILKATDIPVYVINKMGAKLSPLRNNTIFGVVSRDDTYGIENITILINNFLIPFGAFIIVAVCTVVLYVQLRINTKWRTETISDGKTDRISSRNLKVAKMVVTISTLFIVCFTPATILMLALVIVPALSLNGKYVKLSILLGELSNVMEGINSSANIFIYHHMSSKYRDTFKLLFTKVK